MKGMGRTEARSIRVGAVRVMKGRHAGKVGYDDDDSDHAVVYLGEPPLRATCSSSGTTSPT